MMRNRMLQYWVALPKKIGMCFVKLTEATTKDGDASVECGSAKIMIKWTSPSVSPVSTTSRD